jgi:hypothetical protein
MSLYGIRRNSISVKSISSETRKFGTAKVLCEPFVDFTETNLLNSYVEKFRYECRGSAPKPA